MSFTRMRGIDLPNFKPCVLNSSLPACGIDLYSLTYLRSRRSLPRMRGDRPASNHSLDAKASFTPHARGSTLLFLAII